ncbi:DUF2939 domain-containing protein [uncultured Microbulbifer sp.]|uniref:DUF2939 domain-containing protein n=1 Tax=uncultured Microbulbifer sp. TaxID=348147 RepID=UPI002611722F|nr:DUF2939 domain-containing protein [uncultured Microbulbifer sp.]
MEKRLMGKLLVKLALCLVVIAAVYAALPWYSAKQLIEAAHHEDTAALERYVDFPQLRFNIRRRLNDEVQESVGTNVPPELGGLLTAGADLILGPLVDRLISPQGISDLIQGQKDWRELERDLERALGGAGASPPSAPSTSLSPQQPPAPPSATEDKVAADPHDHHWRLRHWYFSGLNTVGVICGNKEDDTGVKLLLRRSGLRWQLVDMHLINSENGE